MKPYSPVPVQEPIVSGQLVSPVWANWFRNKPVQGDTGISGGTGIQGDKGATGLQGIQGLTGIQGAPGIQGATGPQGIQGATGIQGQTGIQGPGVQDFTRSFTSAYPGATIELGNLNIATVGAFDVTISMTGNATDWSFANTWHVTGYYNCTSGNWQQVGSWNEADSNATPTMGLEMRCSTDNKAYFRARVLRTLTTV